MPTLKNLAVLDTFILKWFRECTPKILVVTDGLNFSAGDDFGLTRFVDALRTSTVHAMTPIVRTALYTPGAAGGATLDTTTQHISNFQFTDAAHGLLKSRYDVVFLLAITTEGGAGLAQEPGAQAAIVNFMQQGGGLFATGDHEDLGAAMCMTIPRVQGMRRWAAADTPSGGGIDRLTTTAPGTNDVFEFADQSDALPQRLYVNFRTSFGVGVAHPVLQVPGAAPARAIEVFPDHPHEGECRVPAVLTGKLPDGVTDEWPMATGSTQRVVPEAIALTVSEGNAFPGKAAVAPRSFIPVCAYDGQQAEVGRVVTDSTWHHFVNVNLVGLAGRNLTDVHQYYRNLASWLMPKHVRRCWRYPVLIRELVRYPLFEEIRLEPVEKFDGPALHALGEKVEDALQRRFTRADVAAMVDDALDEMLDARSRKLLDGFHGRYGEVSSRDTGLAALGALTLATGNTALQLQEKGEDVKDAMELFDEAAAKALRLGIQRYLGDAREGLRKLDEVIGAVLR
jgi:hypothetical protein